MSGNRIREWLVEFVCSFLVEWALRYCCARFCGLPSANFQTWDILANQCFHEQNTKGVGSNRGEVGSLHSFAKFLQYGRDNVVACVFAAPWAWVPERRQIFENYGFPRTKMCSEAIAESHLIDSVCQVFIIWALRCCRVRLCGIVSVNSQVWDNVRKQRYSRTLNVFGKSRRTNLFIELVWDLF